MIDKSEIHKYGRSYHVNILVKNKKGLKNLFKIISLANTVYLYSCFFNDLAETSFHYP